MLKETVLLVLFLQVVVHALPIDDGVETKLAKVVLPLTHEPDHDMMETAESKSFGKGGGGKGGGYGGGGYKGGHGGGGHRKGCGCKGKK